MKRIDELDTSNTTNSNGNGNDEKGKSKLSIPSSDVLANASAIEDFTKKVKDVDIEITEDIEPQDTQTIKYLSKVKDSKSGEVSKPFTIQSKRYQMVRGTLGDEVVLGVFCFDDKGEDGLNIIHDVNYFDSTIATPAKGVELKEMKRSTYGNSKHFLVNRNTGDVRNFNSIKELMSGNKLDEEDYMSIKELKTHIHTTLFGKEKIVEEEDNDNAVAEDNDNAVAEKLLNFMTNNGIIMTTVSKITDKPQAQLDAIIGFAKLVGVPKTKITGLINSLKEISLLPTIPIPNVSESTIFKKSDLIKNINK